MSEKKSPVCHHGTWFRKVETPGGTEWVCVNCQHLRVVPWGFAPDGRSRDLGADQRHATPQPEPQPEPIAVKSADLNDPADQIAHPAHYAEGRKHEPIDVIEDWKLGYHLGNATKYISRAGRKGGPDKAIEDLKKAAWYVNREISRLQALLKGDIK